MRPKLLMGVVVVTIDRRFFEGTVHALNLTIRPRVIRLSQPMFNPVLGADAVKQQGKGVAVTPSIGELDAIVGQDGMDLIGYGGNEVA